MHNEGDFNSRNIVAMYGCNSLSIGDVMNGSRFFVLKTRWIRMEDSDWGMQGSPFLIDFAPSALSPFETHDFLGRWPRLLHCAPSALLLVRIRLIQTSRHTAALRSAIRIVREDAQPWLRR